MADHIPHEDAARDAATFQSILSQDDDFEIASFLTRYPHVQENLRPSERRRIEIAYSRIQALNDLVQLVTSPSHNNEVPGVAWALSKRDDSIIEAWWNAICLGCVLDDELMEAGFSAHSRKTARTIAQPLRIHTPLADSEDGQDQSTLRRDNFMAALDSANPYKIVETANAMKQHREMIPVAFRLPLSIAEQQCAIYETMRTALENNNSTLAGRSWARLQTIWPNRPATELDEQGRKAFREIGRKSRRLAAQLQES